MESRACYGYYGEGHGATGETKPKTTSKFQYEFWDVEILYDNGRVIREYKAKDKAHAIRQIEKEIKFTNSEKNLSALWPHRQNRIIEVYWDTLKLDRVGYYRCGF